jgi:hypothetical protein
MRAQRDTMPRHGLRHHAQVAQERGAVEHKCRREKIAEAHSRFLVLWARNSPSFYVATDRPCQAEYTDEG